MGLVDSMGSSEVSKACIGSLATSEMICDSSSGWCFDSIFPNFWSRLWGSTRLRSPNPPFGELPIKPVSVGPFSFLEIQIAIGWLTSMKPIVEVTKILSAI